MPVSAEICLTLPPALRQCVGNKETVSTPRAEMGHDNLGVKDSLPGGVVVYSVGHSLVSLDLGEQVMLVDIRKTSIFS